MIQKIFFGCLGIFIILVVFLVVHAAQGKAKEKEQAIRVQEPLQKDGTFVLGKSHAGFEMSLYGFGGFGTVFLAHAAYIYMILSVDFAVKLAVSLAVIGLLCFVFVLCSHKNVNNCIEVNRNGISVVERKSMFSTAFNRREFLWKDILSVEIEFIKSRGEDGYSYTPELHIVTTKKTLFALKLGNYLIDHHFVDAVNYYHGVAMGEDEESCMQHEYLVYDEQIFRNECR